MSNTTEMGLTAKLRAAASKLVYLQKTGKHGQGYSYVTEAHVKAAVKPVLDEVGLALTNVTYTPYGVPTADACVLLCEVEISDGTLGGQARFQGIGCGNNKGKAPMAACAAALKYALTSAFLIPTGEDPESFPDAEPEPTPSADKPKSSPLDDKRMPPAKNGTASTIASLKALDMMAKAETVPALEALVVELAQLKDSMSAADYAMVRAAYSDREKQLKAKAAQAGKD